MKPGAAQGEGAPPARGLVDMADRVLGVLIRSPRFKGTLRIISGAVDPSSAPRLVKTLIWGDPEIPVLLMDFVPSLANALALGLRETAVQFGQFAPRMAEELTAGVLGRIDARALGEAAAETAELMARNGGPLGETLARLQAEFREGLASKAAGPEAAAKLREAAGRELLDLILEALEKEPELARRLADKLKQGGE